MPNKSDCYLRLMIRIKPFAAIRPPRDKAYLVATRSYLSYSEEELSDKLRNNPYTFLHVINPPEGQGLAPGRQKYQAVRRQFERGLQDGVFRKDDKPAYYLYRQVKDGNEYIGLIAAVAVEDYLQGRIKKHENTLTQRELMFTDYLEETGFNAEPVLLSYRDDLRLAQLFASYLGQRAEYEFTSTDRVLHKMWVIDDATDCNRLSQIFAEQEALYIADGHHRCASSALLAQRLEKKGGRNGDRHRYFMAFLIGEEQMKIFDFNRLLKNKPQKSPQEILAALRKNFIVQKRGSSPVKPEKIHEIGMYLANQWYKLVARSGSFDPRDPVGHLDAEILSRNVLDRVFSIGDLRNDSRVGFLPGTEGLEGLVNQVQSGLYDLAFALHPVTMEQIKQVSDVGAIMPPKSTYIEPKLRSGLTIYQISD